MRLICVAYVALCLASSSNGACRRHRHVVPDGVLVIRYKLSQLNLYVKHTAFISIINRNSDIGNKMSSTSQLAVSLSTTSQLSAVGNNSNERVRLLHFDLVYFFASDISPSYAEVYFVRLMKFRFH